MQVSYLIDVDGNRYLDVSGQVASLSLGYKKPIIIEALTDPMNIPMLAKRHLSGNAPRRFERTLVLLVGMSEDSTMM
jgi:4-aminobutyrate aminotransferase-like enzyme